MPIPSCEEDESKYVLNAHHFLRDVVIREREKSVEEYCHEPLVVRDQERQLGNVMNQIIHQDRGQSTIDQDIILLWGSERRLVTGSDILRRLLQGTKLFGL